MIKQQQFYFEKVTVSHLQYTKCTTKSFDSAKTLTIFFLNKIEKYLFFILFCLQINKENKINIKKAKPKFRLNLFNIKNGNYSTVTDFAKFLG